MVNKNKCLEVGNLLNLKDFVITGNSKSSKNIVENKIISDCCEAIIGAIYLDRGFEVSKIFILKDLAYLSPLDKPNKCFIILLRL